MTAKKKPKVTKNRTRRAPKPTPKQAMDPVAIANQVGDSDLDKVLAILEDKLRK